MTTSTGRGAAEPAPTPVGPQRRGTTKWKLALFSLVGIYVLLAAYSLIANYGELGTNAVASTSKSVSPAASRAGTVSPSAVTPAGPAPVPSLSRGSGPAAHALDVASVAAFGPEGATDGDNPGIVSRILDVSAVQPWYSQWYATPEFGNLRSGTGLLLGLAKTATVTDVRLMLGSQSGADVQVRVGNTPSLDLPTVASASGVGGTVRLTVRSPAKGRYVLIWFTRLPFDGQGHYQVSVYGATVDGTAGA